MKSTKALKSKKAQEILQSGACHVSDGELMDGHRVGCDDLAYYVIVEEAIEQAEAERDAKAVEAFKQMCPFHDGRCRPNCEGCARLNQFIEKLNEE